MENTWGISGNTWFANFGRSQFCMQLELVQMCRRTGKRLQSTILTSDSDSGHGIMRIYSLKSGIWEIYENLEIGCGECFAPVCAHVSRRHVHSVISLRTPWWCEALSAVGPKCKNMWTKIWSENLWRCAHAYGSHEHRWVRSTLRC